MNHLADFSLHTNFFRDVEHKNYHWFLKGAPDAWAAEHGATHTLVIDGPMAGTRPLKLKKTVAYVGVDEAEGGGIVWEKWQIVPDKYLEI
jgi:hypothetical protein